MSMMKKELVLFVVIGIFWFLPLKAEVEIAFTPSDECENKIVNLINNSENSIDVAVYSINNTDIVEAIKLAHDRKINFRILTDKLQAAGKHSKVIELYKYGVNIRVHSKNKIEHNKFAIFDSNVVSTGSFNWTNAASDKNSENCLFLIKEPDNIKAYKERFEELWSVNSEEKSKRWFEKRIQNGK